MTGKLVIRLINKPHPYPDEREAPGEAWGEITIQVVNGYVIQNLYSTQWDLALLAEWFLENREAICEEQLIVGDEKAYSTESLSHTLARFYNREFEDPLGKSSEIWFGTLDDYLTRHNIWQGLIGSKMPMIIIGCQNFEGDISLYNDDSDWSFQFDMKDFVENFQTEIERFIRSWISSTSHPIAIERARNILAQIDNSSWECCNNG